MIPFFGNPLHTFPTRYPATWFVRFAKFSLFTVPFLSFIFCILFLFNIHSGIHREAMKPSESMDDYVQRTGQCLQLGNVTETTQDPFTMRIIDACRELSIATQKYYRKRDSKVNPFMHNFITTASNVCNNETEVIVMVHSLHDYYDRRKTIRETWGGAVQRQKWPNAHIEVNVKVVFVFGLHKNKSLENKLQRESDVYGDVIQGDFDEHYHNMTLKSLLGLKWVSLHCNSAKFLIKSDDDMLINFPALLQYMNPADFRWSIMGPYNGGSRVYRKKSKWSLTKELFPFYTFPPYESGSAYVISSDLVQPLYETSEYVPPIFVDDVYITGILGQILAVKHVQRPGFAYWTSKAPNACQILTKKILTATRMKPIVLYRTWSDLIRKKDC